MKLPDEAITEFQKIFKKEFGIDLSRQEAQEKAQSFLELMKIVTKPLPAKDDSIKL